MTANGNGQPLYLQIENTTLRDNANFGLLLQNNARLTNNGMSVDLQSRNLTITRTSTYNGRGGYPVSLNVQAMNMFPKGNYTGNTIDLFHVNSGINDKITTQVVVANVGVPYALSDYLIVDGPANNALLALSDPGTKLQFNGYGINVKQGGLYAVGTAEQPVVFTSESGRPGGWMGIEFGSKASVKTSAFKHVVVEDAVNGFALGGDPGPIIHESIIQNNRDHGIIVYFTKGEVTDFLGGYGNTFSRNGEDFEAQ
ncbi:hypothetical protein MO973_39225 [Paenibacillus sp. TRM 82003]|nr:hypothetical protein [Paenibacillus sp. TRM 82003]